MISEILETKPSEEDRWAGLPERGTSASLEAIAWIGVRFGRAVARLLLLPIALYFLITAHAARRASYEFLKRARGHSVRLGHVFRHFYYFAATILDRLYLLRGEFERFRVTIHGKEVLQRHMETGKGAILLGSHLGSFEVLRAIGVMQRSFPLKVLMDTAHNENITRFFDALNPDIAETVIPPDRPDTLIKVRESLDANYFIGMLGDRVFGADKTTRCEFLGAPTTLPCRPDVACCHDALPRHFVFRPLPRRESLRHSLRTFRRRDRVESGASRRGDSVVDAALRRAAGALCASGALQLVQLLFVLGLNKEELFRGRLPQANRAGLLQWRIILQSTKRKFAR